MNRFPCLVYRNEYNVFFPQGAERLIENIHVYLLTAIRINMVGGIKNGMRMYTRCQERNVLYGSSSHIYLYTFIDGVRSCRAKRKLEERIFSLMKSSE